MQSDIYILYHIFNKYQQAEKQNDKKSFYKHIKMNIVKISIQQQNKSNRLNKKHSSMLSKKQCISRVIKKN